MVQARRVRKRNFTLILISSGKKRRESVINFTVQECIFTNRFTLCGKRFLQSVPYSCIVLYIHIEESMFRFMSYS